MAEAAATADVEIEDDTVYTVRCTYCLEVEGYLRNPKRLPCGHDICEKCLIDQDKEKADTIKCIVCSQETAIPVVADLPSAIPKQTFCDTCEKKGRTFITATSYCLECNRKYCAKHEEVHQDLNDHHQIMSIADFLKSTYAVEVRFCEKHVDRILSIGCKKCFLITCAKCLSTSAECKQGSSHAFVSMEEVAEEVKSSVEPLKVEVEDRFDEIAALVKEVTIINSQWEIDTEFGVRLIEESEQAQLSAIRKKYATLKEQYVKSRKAAKDKIESYLGEQASVRMTEFLEHLKTLNSDLSDKHPVDLVKEKVHIEERIEELIREDFPKLVLENLSEPNQTDTQMRELEVVLSSVVDISIGDNVNKPKKLPLPSSMQIMKSVDEGFTTSNPMAICMYRGVTYVGMENGSVVKIDEDDQISPSFIKPDKPITSIRAHSNQLFILKTGKPYRVLVYDLIGHLAMSWDHTESDDTYYGSKMSIVGNNIVLVDRGNQNITVHTSDGTIVKRVNCPKIKMGQYVTMCEAGEDCVILTSQNPSEVYKLNLTSGEVEWTNKQIVAPQGVTCYGTDYVIVSHYGISKIWILDVHTGELLTELEDITRTSSSYVFDLCADGDTLIMPRYITSTLLYYKMVKESQ